VGAVRLYFDSNVIIAALVQSHSHHVPALSSLVSVQKRANEGFLSAHALAESYVLLSRALYPDFVSTSEAWNAISTNILPFFSIVTLTAQDYQRLLERSASKGIAGAKAYDALHIHAAIKAKCDRLFTFNVKHFRQLAPPEYSERVVLPN
jgi:predicted nucleic acid-binding protein